MHNVILIIHLVLALSLIGVVLLQRSEGGGLGMGSGGGGGGVMTGRAAASALSKITWGLAIAFLCTSLALTIIAARENANASVSDRLGAQTAPATQPSSLSDSAGDTLLPPAPESDDLVPTLD